ncbi:tetratricopeptide repeat protein, partial [Nocardiopsis sp. NPDC055879]
LLDDQLRILGPDHPDTLTTRHNLAVWTYECGDSTNAIRLLAVLVVDLRRVLGPDYPDTQASGQVLRYWQDEPSEEQPQPGDL